MSFNYIDLFSGAGGLSEGFIQSGFNSIAHVEMDSKACQTLETRLVYHKLRRENRLDGYYDYIFQKVSREEFLDNYSSSELSGSVINLPIGGENNQIIFDKISSLAKNQSIDLIIGGPPCQAYSLIGRSRDKNKMSNDPRNFLYREYACFLDKFRPKVFVFENVTGLLTANGGRYLQDMQQDFRSVGYELELQVQKSEDFGVLQKRRRVILIGWQKGLNFTYPVFPKVEQKYTVREALLDLKYLEPGEQNIVSEYASPSTEYLSKFNIRNGVEAVTQHIARPHNSRDLEIYKIAIEKWLERTERLKYPDLPAELKTHKNVTSFVDRYKVVDVNGLSHTVVAHIAKDGHYYIYPDKKQVRSLSVREAARLQSFPDNYFFEGGRTAAFRQIGNAVPPLMAAEIAKQIAQQL